MPVRATMPLAFDLDARHEQFVAAAFDKSGAALAHLRIDSDHCDHTDVRFRDIFTMALGCGASVLAVAHTHPSGDPKPSRTDIRMTRTLAQLCKDLDIHLADHLILARGGRFSFREAGLL